MSPIKVVLADDQDLIRSGIALILSLEEQIEVVAQVANGADTVAAVAEHTPDIVLMDVQMPVLDGIAATARIQAQYPDTRVLVLTTFDREDYLFDALAAGAAGFLLKTAEADDLVDAIYQIHAGNALLAPQMTLPVIRRLVDADLPAASKHVPLTDQQRFILESLTAREREILILLTEGLSNAEIAERLFVGTTTVKTHVSSVLAKTQSRDRVNAVIFAHRVGLAS